MGDHESRSEMNRPPCSDLLGVVTIVNGPKVNSLPTALVTVRTAFGYMLENPSIRPVLVLDFGCGQ